MRLTFKLNGNMHRDHQTLRVAGDRACKMSIRGYIASLWVLAWKETFDDSKFFRGGNVSWLQRNA